MISLPNNHSPEFSSLTLAVIDIGTTSIRMAIAQVNKEGLIQLLETLQQSLSLGKDTFTKGYIHKTSIEECVNALKSFKKVLKEYQIINESQIRIVATTAVREASNKDTFLDRIYIATGMNVEVIDEVDVARLTYLSIRSFINTHPSLLTNELLVTEMSGGTTEILLLQNNNVTLSKGYRLGALRLREMVGEFRAPLSRHRDLMENDIQRTVNQIQQDITLEKKLTLVAIGGDARFAASQIHQDWNVTDPIEISLSSLVKFSEKVISLSVDEIVHQYHITFADAETLGPALLFYIRLADSFSVNNLVISDISMRHGLFAEMSRHDAWSEGFTNQIINSAKKIGRKFDFNETHADYVLHLSTILFNALKEEHLLAPRYELLLQISALLHDIGSFISVKSHHKHSFYLIQNSELFGLNRKDIQLIALVARYHRRSAPKPVHEEYQSLDRESKLLVIKLAAILRVADALDRSNSHRIKNISCLKQKGNLVITITGIEDLSLEQLALQSKGSLFEDIYGMKIILKKQASITE